MAKWKKKVNRERKGRKTEIMSKQSNKIYIIINIYMTEQQFQKWTFVNNAIINQDVHVAQSVCILRRSVI